jgi:hypothetical protein
VVEWCFILPADWRSGSTAPPTLSTSPCPLCPFPPCRHRQTRRRFTRSRRGWSCSSRRSSMSAASSSWRCWACREAALQVIIHQSQGPGAGCCCGRAGGSARCGLPPAAIKARELPPVPQ